MSLSSRSIAVRRRGNAFGFWVFRACTRLLGLRGAYGLLYPVCLYYALFDRSARAAAAAYVSRRFRDAGAVRRWLHAYRLFVSQGKQIIDRYAHISSKGLFDIRLTSTEEAVRLLTDPAQAVILLTAHVGNWQVAMSRLGHFGRCVYLVMRPEDNPAVRETLRVGEDSEAIRLIPPEGDFGGVIDILKKLDEGHIVSIMGDRRYGFNSIPVEFLGDEAQFPHGAFTIAAAAGCPIIVLLSMKLGRHLYEVDVSRVFRPHYIRGMGKQEQLRDWVQQYARILEQYVAQYPYQCFLFHDVWARGPDSPDSIRP
jgi:predicted LPLAT superfamily acyltransferase